jgi:hypothetical protein
LIVGELPSVVDQEGEGGRRDALLVSDCAVSAEVDGDQRGSFAKAGRVPGPLSPGVAVGFVQEVAIPVMPGWARPTAICQFPAPRRVSR